MKKFVAFFTLLFSCAVWVSCSFEKKQIDDSSIFSVQKREGFYGTHSPASDSLVAKHEQGGWKTIWNGIRSVEKTWGDKVLFVAQTSNKSVDEDYSFLFYQNGKEVVDITSELLALKRTAITQDGIAETNTLRSKWEYDADGIILIFHTGHTNRTKIPLKQIVETSERVRLKATKSSFNGNQFYK